MKFLPILLLVFLFACSENASAPLQVSPEQVSPNIAVEPGARAYLFDTLGVKEARVVFRNDETENLVLVQFMPDTTIAVEYDLDIDVYHPVFSPDGSWIAFGTSPEPVGGRLSRVYLQRFENFTERIPMDFDSAIPRFRVLPSGDTVLIYVETSYINDSTAFWNSQSTWMAPFQNGTLGTSTPILSGFYHGGVSEDFRFAVTGSHYLRVHSEIAGVKKDTIWYDSAQVCNVSLSTDGTLRTLFLDLGASRGVEFSGAEYSGHHRLLIADSLGNLIESVPSPEPYSFDHPEWVYGSSYLVSTILARDFHEKVALLDVRDSSVHPLVSGNELWHPDIWIKK